MNVAVDGRVAVGVSVGVGVSPELRAVWPAAPDLNAKNMITPATTMTTARMPTAAGSVSVISGMRLACTDRSAFRTTFGSGRGENSVPHTRQRVALSLRRVPQVGQIFVLFEVLSGLIRAEIIPSNFLAHFFA
jgi:hypothetical protein